MKTEHPAVAYYETHRADIVLCEAAKKYFNEQSNGKNNKLPSINMLKAEYAKLEKEKRQLYCGYKEQRGEMIDLKMAKQNVDIFFGEPRQPALKRSREHSL